MHRYEVRENSRWNANIVGFWVVVDVFGGSVVCDGFVDRARAVAACSALNSR